jgi:hypothetical protein
MLLKKVPINSFIKLQKRRVGEVVLLSHWRYRSHAGSRLKSIASGARILKGETNSIQKYLTVHNIIITL